MSTKIKYKKLDVNFVRKNYPILYDTVEDLVKDTIGNKFGGDEKLKQHIAGLCLEIALKSDGTTDIFEDDLPSEFLGEPYLNENY